MRVVAALRLHPIQGTCEEHRMIARIRVPFTDKHILHAHRQTLFPGNSLSSQLVAALKNQADSPPRLNPRLHLLKRSILDPLVRNTRALQYLSIPSKCILRPLRFRPGHIPEKHILAGSFETAPFGLLYRRC